MTIPLIEVLVGFQSTATFGGNMQLDGPNIAKNQLDTGTLGGIVYANLTTMVQSININRGRSRQLQEFTAGTATVSFWNKDRSLDPLNSSSPYWNSTANSTGVVPRLPIIVKANGITIYTGVITDWNVDYDLANNDIVYATCADDFTVLSSIILNDHATTEQLSNVRINEVLNYSEVVYQGPRSISTGSSTMGGTPANTDFSIVQGTPLLNYLQTVTTSEQGYLYMSADGELTFKGRTSVLNPVPSATFSGEPGTIPIQSLENQFGDELLYNVVVTQSPAGVAVTASDSESINQYQTQTLNLTTLLNASQTEVTQLGQYLLGKYAQPVLRFTGLSTQLVALSTDLQNVCLNLDLTDICTVIKYFSSGTPASVGQTLIVSGVRHSITPGSHIIAYTFESTDSNQYFTLNDAVFGKFEGTTPYEANVAYDEIGLAYDNSSAGSLLGF